MEITERDALTVTGLRKTFEAENAPVRALRLNYDDLPFFPWRGDRFSAVLQVPIHPICEGLFFDAGARDPE